MAWQQNLLSNLLVIAILLAITLLGYSKITGKTLLEIVTEIKEIFSPSEEIINYGKE